MSSRCRSQRAAAHLPAGVPAGRSAPSTRHPSTMAWYVYVRISPQVALGDGVRCCELMWGSWGMLLHVLGLSTHYRSLRRAPDRPGPAQISEKKNRASACFAEGNLSGTTTNTQLYGMLYHGEELSCVHTVANSGIPAPGPGALSRLGAGRPATSGYRVQVDHMETWWTKHEKSLTRHTKFFDSKRHSPPSFFRVNIEKGAILVTDGGRSVDTAAARACR
jgi:hypothetical protein